jgi:flotillin
MAAKADAWKQYGDAALSQLIIDKLPQIAEAVAGPLAAIDRVVIMDGGGDAGIRRGALQPHHDGGA